MIRTMNLFKRTFLTIAVFSLCTFSHAIFSEELGKKYQKIEKDYKKLAEKRGFISTESDISHEVCRLFEEEILDLQNLSPSKKTKKEAEIRKALGAKHTNGFTPIFYAVLTKNAPLVRKMIDYGADVNETDSQKRMPLLFRAINEESPDYETVKAILSAKKCNADFRYTSNQYVNVTPLLLACTKKNPEIIKIVLEKARRFCLSVSTSVSQFVRRWFFEIFCPNRLA